MIILHEDWKPISEYPNYSISTIGRIRKNTTERIMKQYFDGRKTGYFSVRFSHKNVRSKRCFIHRLVAQAFIPNPFEKYTVNHIDGDGRNNNVENLQWCSQAENLAHSRKVTKYSKVISYKKLKAIILNSNFENKGDIIELLLKGCN